MDNIPDQKLCKWLIDRIINRLIYNVCVCVCVCVFMHVLQERDYEIRTYHATKWVSTTLSGMQWDAAMNTGFRRLFNYIQGKNQNSKFHLFCFLKRHMGVVYGSGTF